MLLVLVAIQGCETLGGGQDYAEMTPQQLEQLAPVLLEREKQKTMILQATLEDGTDERCLKVGSFELYCRERTRRTNGNGSVSSPAQ